MKLGFYRWTKKSVIFICTWLIHLPAHDWVRKHPELFLFFLHGTILSGNGSFRFIKIKVSKWDPKWNLHKMKFCRVMKKIMLTWLFMFWGWGEMTHFIKANHICFYEIFACVDVSCWMISFQIVSTWHFVILNWISK